MGKRASLVYQITQVLNENFYPGESRHAIKQQARLEGRRANAMTDHITSYQTFQTYQRILIRFVKWVRQRYRVREIAQLTPAMATVWIQECRTTCAPNTLRTYLTALKRLDKAAAHLLGEPLVTPALEKGIHRAFSPRRAYTPEEAETILTEIATRDAFAATALRVLLEGALRIRELVHLSPKVFADKHTREARQGIDVTTGTVYVRGKGGLQRAVALGSSAALRRVDLQAAHPLRRGKTNAWMSHLRRLVRAACRKHGIEPRGLHAFRATGAQVFHAACLAAGDSSAEADRKTAHRLGHRRTEVLRHYLGGVIPDHPTAPPPTRGP